MNALYLTILAVSGLSAPNGEEDPPWRYGATSPKVEELRRRVGAGDREAVEQFWRDRKASGTPLVEPEPEGSDRVLLTFLYRAGESVRGVALVSGLTGRENPNEQSMARLPGTDVWYLTYKVRGDLRFSYGFAPDKDQAGGGRNAPLPDPLNPRRAPSPSFGPSVVQLPRAADQHWLDTPHGAPRGRLEQVEIESQPLHSRRSARVYTPAGHDPARATPYDLIVCFDGPLYRSADLVPGPTILEYLIAAGRVPPAVMVFVEQSADRNRELCNDQALVDFLADELLPTVRRRWRATADPERTVVCGSSAGGLGAAFAAYARPGVFGNVLSQSGAFWPGHRREDTEREWLTRQYESAPRRSVRFVLQVGVMERHSTPGDGPSILRTNRSLQKVLSDRGYEVHYTEVAGGHEPLSWRGGFGEGLVTLLGDGAAPPGPAGSSRP
jgi:enterochelin esterase family protein